MSHKVANQFVCEICNYNCYKKSDIDKHKLTAKHINRTNRTEKKQKGQEAGPRRMVGYDEAGGSGDGHRHKNSVAER